MNSPTAISYQESDFHACLLAHGWHNSMENPSAYWFTIDMWFQKCWPDRYVKYQTHEDYSGQMEFKVQYFDWLRHLNYVPTTPSLRPTYTPV